MPHPTPLILDKGGDTEKEKMTIARRCVCVCVARGGDYSREAIGLNISV